MVSRQTLGPTKGNSFLFSFSDLCGPRKCSDSVTGPQSQVKYNVPPPLLSKQR